METLTPISACRHTSSIRLTTTQPTQFIDLTDRLQRLVADAGLRFGILNVQTLHTTTAVVVNEHEPRTVNVTDAERANGHAHCRALMLPSSACLNVTGGRILLGRWQRIFFVELDGPRAREVSVLVFGESAR